MNKIKTLAIFTIIIFFFNLNKVYASDIFIEFKIENEVITNIDINKEKNYLIALNNNLKNISKKQLYEISKKSVINETIKKKEILNYFDLEKAELVMDVIIADFYKQLGFKNKEEFKNYLQNYQVSINFVREKLKIEALWNQLVYKKYSNNIEINEEEIRESITIQFKNSKKKYEYNLSEIVFQEKQNENILDTLKKIKDSIKKVGFENTATMFSLSNTSKNGGLIGWINEVQITEKIRNEISKLKINQISNPIKIPNGILLIKINEKKEFSQKIDIEKELKRFIEIEKNRQLNNFSIIFYKRLKQNTVINDY